MKRNNNYRPDYQAHLPRTDHNLSQRLVFTSSVGHILPIFQTRMNPSERITGKLDLFTRTQPLITATMAEIEEEIHFFFVPLMKLFTGFESWAYGTNDYLSSTFMDSSRTLFPLLNASIIQDDWATWLAGHEDVAGDNLLSSSFRLFNHLGYNPNLFFKNAAIQGDTTYPIAYNTNQPSIFPYALLAYHAIYYDFFSNDDREKRQVNYYNWDRYWESGWTLSETASQGDYNIDVERFTALHYVNYANDYFQDSYPTPLASQMNLRNDESSALADKVKNWLNTANSPIGFGTDGDSDTVIDNTSSIGSEAYSFANTSVIRSTFAVEKYLRVLGKAEKTYDAQVLAHLGFKVPHDVKHQITHIGSFRSKINIGEVISTSETWNGETGTSLGDIAGKGYGKREGQVFDFTAPVHGVVMGVYFARPKPVYTDTGFEKVNAFASPNDLWNPEFDQLGVQPLYGYEVSNLNNQQGTGGITSWQTRYKEMKQKFDKATYAFAGLNRNRVDEPGSTMFNVWTAWIAPRQAPQAAEVVDFKNFLVQPTDLNRMMVQQYSTEWSWSYMNTPWLIFQGDPMLHDLHMYVKLVSPMSKTGEPRLDL